MFKNKKNLIVDLFKNYCKFFVVENQTALLEGRNYKIIYMFLINFCSILVKDKHDYGFCKESIEYTGDEVSKFIDKAKLEYVFIKIPDCCKYDDKLSVKSFYLDVETEKMFEYFYKAYSIYSNYQKVELVNELLIEFNNFLSHFAKHITDRKRSTGISHLYRGCLDGHKEIIKENKNFLLGKEYPELVEDFIKLRIYETRDIGNISKADDKEPCNILDEYENMSNDIITILN